MKTKLIAFAAALALSAPAFAQDNASTARGHSRADFMTDYDANSDAVVARAEFDARRSEHFGRFDTNGDGRVSEEEYVAEYAARLDAELAATRERQLRQAHVRYGVLDADHNSDMTRAEFDASGARMFSRLDTNTDSVVDERDTAERY
jgi:hypothetical protein